MRLPATSGVALCAVVYARPIPRRCKALRRNEWGWHHQRQPHSFMSATSCRVLRFAGPFTPTVPVTLEYLVGRADIGRIVIRRFVVVRGAIPGAWVEDLEDSLSMT